MTFSMFSMNIKSVPCPGENLLAGVTRLLRAIWTQQWRIGIRTNKFLNRLEIVKEINGKWLKTESEVRIKKHFYLAHKP